MRGSHPLYVRLAAAGKILAALSILACVFLSAIPASVSAKAEQGGVPTWTYMGRRIFLGETYWPTCFFYDQVSVSRSYTGTSLHLDVRIDRDQDAGGAFRLAFASDYRWSEPPLSVAVGCEDELAISGTLALSDFRFGSYYDDYDFSRQTGYEPYATMGSVLRLGVYDRNGGIIHDDRSYLSYDLIGLSNSNRTFDEDIDEVIEEGTVDFPMIGYYLGVAILDDPDFPVSANIYGTYYGIMSWEDLSEGFSTDVSPYDTKFTSNVELIAQGLHARNIGVDHEDAVYVLELDIWMQEAGCFVAYYYTYDPG